MNLFPSLMDIPPKAPGVWHTRGTHTQRGMEENEDMGAP